MGPGWALRNRGISIMYKKQMAAQKVICLLSMIASAVVFVYSLGLMTDLFDSLYSTMRDPSDLTKTTVPGSILYYDMQPFNQQLLLVSIGLILLSALLFITNTSTRRKYYVGNYTAISLNVVANAAVAAWAHIKLAAFRAQYLQIDFEALAKHAKRYRQPYIESTFWFDLHNIVFALTLIVSVLLVLNAIWKIKLMKDEKKLIEAGKAVSA